MCITEQLGESRGSCTAEKACFYCFRCFIKRQIGGAHMIKLSLASTVVFMFVSMFAGCADTALPTSDTVRPTVDNVTCAQAIVTDSELVVDHCARPADTFAGAQNTCTGAGFHLPSLGDLAEVYASGAAADPGREEWIDDGEVVRRNEVGALSWRTPSQTETFPFRCVASGL